MAFPFPGLSIRPIYIGQHFCHQLIQLRRNLLIQIQLRQNFNQRRVFLYRHAMLFCLLKDRFCQLALSFGYDNRRIALSGRIFKGDGFLSCRDKPILLLVHIRMSTPL